MSERFDDFAQALAGATTRRAMLKTLLAGAAGLATGWLTPEGASARACKVNSDCPPGFTCQRRICCVESESNCGGTCCNTNLDQLCCNGQCVKRSDAQCEACNKPCAANEKCCGGKCTDVLNDNDNCRDCGRSCGRGTCELSQCVCPSGATPCSRGTGFDCCPAEERCVSGFCVCPDCKARNRNGTCVSCSDRGQCCDDNGYCVDKCPGCLTCNSGVCTPDNDKCSDVCHVCDRFGVCSPCQEDRRCCSQEGVCVQKCPSGQTCLAANPHGGSDICCPEGTEVLCKQTCCPKGQECIDGNCKPKRCTPGRDSLPASLLALADAAGVTLVEAPPAECGPCEVCSAEHVCVSTCKACETCQNGACVSTCTACETCQNGACVSTCVAGQTCCSGACKSLQTDTANCGSCGNACSSGQTCQNGQCASACNPPCQACETCSAGVCKSTCPAGETCQNGVCVCGGQPACSGGQTCCSGNCVDLQSNFGNCGSCGHGCNASAQQTCAGGVCRAGHGGMCDPAIGFPCCGGEVCAGVATPGTGRCGCARPGIPCTSSTDTALGVPCCNTCDSGVSGTCT